MFSELFENAEKNLARNPVLFTQCSGIKMDLNPYYIRESSLMREMEH